ncbi:MAG: hypothetical protein ACTHKF_08065 [Candidatus Nitrosocosmicus sp.]
MIDIKRPESVLIVLILIVGGVVGYYVIISIPSQKYSLDIDAIKDPESLFVNSRVILKNTGLSTVNNINIVYDNNLKYMTKINSLNPGQTIIISPPVGAPLNNLQVTSQEGISLSKDFRSPVKLPGMIGS